MFNTILIANRGEIAVRIMATCREMGIRTVAVYSEADRQARHVREADEAYCIGAAPATQSYLRIDAILEAARASGAEAIHPGYGFLSENAEFAEACERAGIVFIGPPAEAMRLMGSKIAAKELAQRVGAPTVPGYNGAEQDDQTLQREAERIGFPLLIKASAGGGGKGMRIVESAEEFLPRLAGARREALAAFGDGTVFLEKLLVRPRHIEIQVLGDRHGNLIHLGERECSIQRRHQKIVEESPSVALTPELRAEMGAAAVRIAKAAGYINAGTLEFMLDEEQRFYFLEMNTRLQVEHPVTELVTGLDLVRHQILIAAGEPLAITQEQIEPRGHAIEVRLYAEDPAQNFLPSTGTLALFAEPTGPGIRVDSGVSSGDDISQYYDPMIAKLIAYGENRAAALARLRTALERCAVLGVTTNLPLLSTISKNQAFQQGQTHTGFLDEQGLLEPAPQAALPFPVLAAAALSEIEQPTTKGNPWQTLGPWRLRDEWRELSYQHGEQDYRVSLRPALQQPNVWDIAVNGDEPRSITALAGYDTLVVIRSGAQQERLYVDCQRDAISVAYRGQVYTLQRRQPPDIEHALHGSSSAHTQKALKAPMAGTIIKVQVEEGATVKANQVLVILTAMKMEHSIIAPYEGRVQRIHCKEGSVVTGGSILVEME